MPTGVYPHKKHTPEAIEKIRLARQRRGQGSPPKHKCAKEDCSNLCQLTFCSLSCKASVLNRKRRGIPKLRPFESLFHQVQYEARKRDLECTLTYEDFLECTKVLECHYCGGEIDWSGREHSWRAKNKAGYFLDRKDSSKGYLEDNVVVACIRCNRAKGSINYEEFFAWIAKIAKRHDTARN